MSKVTEKETNADRAARRLRNRIRRQHNWRVQVWAQCELRIRAYEQELTDQGYDPPELLEPDFTDPGKLEAYANLLSGD